MPPVDKSHLYEFVSRIGKGVASSKRLELLDLLCQGEKTVEELATQAGISVKLTSAHLQNLKNITLAEGRRDGKNVRYRVANHEVIAFWVTLRSLAEKQLYGMKDALREYFDDSRSMVPVDRNTLLKRTRSGDVIVIDVRPRAEFEAGHFPGARSIPLDQLTKMLKTLPKSKEIVAYCRGPYCVLAKDAVELLRRHGFKALRFKEGVSDWIAAGVPIEREWRT